MLNDSKWDKLAVPAPRIQRQVHRQNPTLGERKPEQELRPQIGRLRTGKS